MRIGIVGELDKNGLSYQTYDSILKVKNLPLENNVLEIDLILLDAEEEDINALPCDSVFVYNQLTGENHIDKTVKAIEDYYLNNDPLLVVVSLDNNTDSIIPKAVIKINTDINHTKMITGFLECDHVLFEENINKVIVTKPVYGGNVMAHYSIEKSAIVSFKHNIKSKTKLELKNPKINFVECQSHFDNHHINSVDMEYIEEEGLEDSDFVVVCGKGVGSKKAVEEIATWAATVGAAIGGTKKVIDHGWLPIHHLIGQTGHTISPKTCLVIGASGATPFINGIIGSEKIIAINNDKNARIFDYADIGIVEDYKVITSGLITTFNELECK
ncbi:MAG: electron transfer flavoprotein subunit alpha/FixB family protein [Clostridiales bacterium]|nr:electron transfer flavoprotein subunit alpha/FixB family protein [Clostridiales bacterium]